MPPAGTAKASAVVPVPVHATSTSAFFLLHAALLRRNCLKRTNKAFSSSHFLFCARVRWFSVFAFHGRAILIVL